MRQVTESADGGRCQLPVGELLEIVLGENPTAGYRWRLQQSGEPVCVLLTDRFLRGSRVGQPGTHLWEFRAEMAGVATIELAYSRVWEASSAPPRNFTLRVEVSEPSPPSHAG
jgi:predicted secreted protein